MSEILLNTIVEKADAQEKKITEMQGTLKNVPGTEEIRHIEKEVGELKTTVNNISFPTQAMQELSNRLAESTRLLRQPVINKVLHHHYVPKIIWIAAGLFIALSLTCSGWYITAGKLTEFKASDTKYRYLKLKENQSLQQLLYIADSLYRIDKGMRDSVQQQEETLRQRFELEQRIIKKEKEVSRLKEKMK